MHDLGGREKYMWGQMTERGSRGDRCPIEACARSDDRGRYVYTWD
jgi:hypothetical protein